MDVSFRKNGQLAGRLDSEPILAQPCPGGAAKEGWAGDALIWPALGNTVDSEMAW